MAITDAPAHHHRPVRLRRRATPSTRYQRHRRLRRRCARRSTHDARRGASTRSRTASLLGRGGAGFPAGVKWGFCPPGVWPRYLVVNGDESEPGTYKDRLLMERDPHQLIEGILIACYAVGLRPGLPLRPRRDGPGPGAHRRGPQRGLRRRLRRQEHPRHRLLASTSCCTGAPAPTSSARRPALIESLEGNRGMPRLKPPFFPAAKGLYLQPTIVNNVETLSNLPWIIEQRRRRRSPRSAPRPSTGTRMFAVSGHVKQPGVFEVEYGVTTFRDLLYAPSLRRRHPRRPRAQGVHPRRRVGAVVLRGAPRPAAREAGTVDRAGSMLGSGAIVVMDETTDIGQGLPARRAVLRPRVVRQVHAVPRGHARWLERILAAHPRRPRPAERPRPAARRLRQHQPGHRLAARSRRRSARSARRPCRRSPRPSSASATSSRPTSTGPSSRASRSPCPPWAAADV